MPWIFAILTFLSMVSKQLASVLASIFQLILMLVLQVIDFLIELSKKNKPLIIGILLGAFAVTFIVWLVHHIKNHHQLPKPVAVYEATAIRAVDGGSIEIKKKWYNRKQVLILSGIRVPKLDRPIGQQAKDFLHELIAGTTVRIERYRGDILNAGVVYTSQGDCVQAALVRHGFAWAIADKWKKEETEAKKRKLGIWSVYADIDLTEDEKNQWDEFISAP